LPATDLGPVDFLALFLFAKIFLTDVIKTPHNYYFYEVAKLRNAYTPEEPALIK
jgi:hypothetical protein